MILLAALAGVVRVLGAQTALWVYVTVVDNAYAIWSVDMHTVTLRRFFNGVAGGPSRHL